MFMNTAPPARKSEINLQGYNHQVW
jgi:hypothetical protein